MGSAFLILALVVVLALAFDYINGFHDTANAVATVISTNVLPARTAILLAAIMNVAGAFAGTGVAKTIAAEITDPATITQVVVVAALLSGIVWNLLTWYYGIPSSSSHALIGGLVGSVFAFRVREGAGWGGSAYDLAFSTGVKKALGGLVLSPIAGLLCGLLLMILLLWVANFLAPRIVNSVFRKLQLVSASFMAFAHGSNDAQKAMGVITMALVGYCAANPDSTAGWVHFNKKGEPGIPTWVIVGCATAMGLGTASGGMRIIKTMGHRIIKLRPINGFAAETAAALVISVATHLHAPVSSTHVISSSIMGVGAAKRISAVRWGVAQRMIVAWILTIPVTALLAGLLYVGLAALLGR